MSLSYNKLIIVKSFHCKIPFFINWAENEKFSKYLC